MRGVMARVLFSFVVCSFLVFASAPQAFAREAGASSARGSNHTGFVKIAKDRELYVSYDLPVPGKPTIVLLNGLTYRLGSWDPFVRFLHGKGYGILRYDPMGMGQTLIKYAPALDAFPIEEQVDDLAKLLERLKVNEPVHLVGLSYGGALGMQFAVDYPKRVATLIMMAPFVAALENQDVWIRLQIHQTRILFPANPASFDELYDFFLRQIIYTTYPVAEPIVLENPFKLEATFRLVQGIRKWQAKEIVGKLPAGKSHLMLARQDQYVSNAIHDKLWTQIPTPARASRLYIEGSEHKIPEAVPAFAAAWVLRIVEGDSRISGGKTFVGNPWDGTAESGPLKIPVTEKE